MVKPGESGPSFVQKPYIDQSPDGRLLTFACKISGNPKPSITWYRDDTEIRDGGRYFINVRPEGSHYVVSVEIDEVSPSDAGTYKIVARNQYGETSGTIALNFGQGAGDTRQQIDGTAPRFTMKPNMKQIDDGKKLKIDCELQADPRPKITWTRNGKEIFDGGKFHLRTEVDEDIYFLSLTIDDVGGADGGDYVIFAKNDLGESTSTIKLNFANRGQAPPTKDAGGAGEAPVFTMKPQIKQSKDGRRLTFECEIKATPRPTITWYKGDMPIKDGGRYLIEVDEDDAYSFSVLEIDGVTPKDAADYRVVARNKYGETTQTINLNFDSEPAEAKPATKRGRAPKFEGKPAIKQSEDGHRMSFEVELNSDPEPKITWYKADKVITQGGRFNIITEREGSTGYFLALEIDDVTPTDGGVYKVIAANEFGESTSTINLNFDVKSAPPPSQSVSSEFFSSSISMQLSRKKGKAPHFAGKPKLQQSKDGHRMSFEAELTADPEPTITWYRGDQKLKQGGRINIIIEREGAAGYFLILEIDDVTPEDGGVYKVVAANEFGESTSTINLNFDVKSAPPSRFVETERFGSITLTIQPARKKGKAPKFAGKPKLNQSKDGRRMSFEAELTADPQPTITWYCGDRVVTKGGRFNIITEKEGSEDYFLVLEISDVTPSDGGMYKVIAVNEFGESTSTINLNFDVKSAPPSTKFVETERFGSMTLSMQSARKKGKAPKFAGKPKLNQSKDGRRMSFEAELTADPQPTITWYCGDRVITKGGRFNIITEKEGSEDYFLVLEISDVTPSDGGVYKVIAVNEFGESTSTINLNFDVKSAPPSTKFVETERFGSMTLSMQSARKKGKAPKFAGKPKLNQSKDGCRMSFEAELTADPQPTITWYCGDRVITKGDRFNIITEKEGSEDYFLVLEISDVTPSDGGVYKVIAVNEFGESTSTINLNFDVKESKESKRGAPSFPGKPSIRQEDGGRTLILEQRVIAIPRPTVVWRHANRVVTDGGRFAISIVSKGDEYILKLVVSDVKPEDGGIYTINAKNDKGEGNSTITINFDVQQAPEEKMPEIKPFQLDLVDAGDLQIIPDGDMKIEVASSQVETQMSKVEVSSAKTTSTAEEGAAKTEKPKFLEELKDKSVTDGDEVTFRVRVTGVPEPKITWYSSGKEIKPSADFKITKLKEVCTLVFIEVFPEDSGIITCKAVNRAGEATTKAKLDVKEPPPRKSPPKKDEPSKKPQDKKPVEEVMQKAPKKDVEAAPPMPVVEEPMSAKKTTPAQESAPPVPVDEPAIQAKKGAAPVEAAPPRDEGDKTSDSADEEDDDLIIEPPNFRRERRDSLAVRVGIVSKDQQESQVIGYAGRRVKVPPPVKPKQVEEPTGKPYFLETPQKGVVTEGQSIKFEAEIGGVPQPKLTWYKGARVLTDGGRYVVFYNEKTKLHILEIRKCEPRDTGRYTCKIENENGSDKVTFSLMVNELPKDEMDFRSLLKHREFKRRSSKDEGPDWGKLKHIEQESRPLAEITAPLQNTTVNESFGRSRMTIGVKYQLCTPTWFKDGKPITLGKKYKMFKKAEELDFVIVDISPADSGEYGVEFGGGDLPVLASSKANLVVERGEMEPSQAVERNRTDYAAKPKTEFTSKLRSTDVNEGKDAKFDCIVSNSKLPVVWQKNGKELEDDDKYQISRTGGRHQLLIKNVLPADAGEVKIIVGDTEDTAELFVTPKPKPKFIKPLKSQEVTLHTPSVIACELSFPDKEVLWFKDGKPIKPDDRVKITHEGIVHKLSIADTNLDDEGEYEAKVKGEEEISSFCELLVEEAKVPVKFQKPLKDVAAEVDKPAEFVTEVNDPDTPVEWLKDGKPLKPTDRIKMIKKGKERILRIDPVTTDDIGEYTCVAADKKVNAKLSVEEKTPRKKEPREEISEPPVAARREKERESAPSLPTDDNKASVPTEPPKLKIPDELKTVRAHKGKPAKLEAPISGKPMPKVKWLKNGKPIKPSDGFKLSNRPDKAILDIPACKKDDAGDYQIEISNERGSDVADIKLDVLDVPKAPKSISVTAASKTTISVAWVPPDDDGGEPITGYKVEKCEAKTKNWTTVEEDVPETKFTVPKLIEGKDYLIRVRAKNKVGVSEPKSLDKPVKARDPFDEPGAPTQPEVVDVRKDHAKIKWAAPKFDGGTPITGYVVEKKKKGGKWEDALKEPVQETEATIPNLEAGKDYEFRVLAENAAGESEPSKPSKAVTASDEPKAPSQPEVVNVRKDRAKLKWEAPKDDGGSPIKGYVVEKKKKDGEWEEALKKPVQGTEATVPDLEAGKDYEFRVLAENAAGESEPSEPSKAVTACDEPDAPTRPEVVDVQKDQAKIKWEAPKNDGGSPIKGYKVQKKEDNGKWQDALKEPVKETEATIPKLDAGKDYAFRVLAENPGGLSEPSQPSKAVTACDEPKAPSQPEVVNVRKDRAKLKWEAPKDDGGSPIKGYVVEKKKKDGEWEEALKKPVQGTEATVPDLEAGKDYEFRVLAENAAGESEPSEPSKAVTACDEPDAPTRPEVVDVQKDQAKIKWEAPKNDGGSPIKGYKVQKKEDNGKWQDALKEPVKETEATIPKLDAGKDYAFRVLAENPGGLSEPSQPSKAVTACDEPKAPSQPEVVNVRKDRAKLKWEAPKDDGGSPIKGYVVEKKKKDGEWEEALKKPVQGTEATVPDLEAGKDYEFRVLAENAAGESEPSEPSKAVTACDEPDAPTRPEVVDVQKDQAKIKWEAPKNDGGSPIKGYKVQKKEDNGKWQDALKEPVKETEATIPKLDAGKDYAFRVLAENPSGLSEQASHLKQSLPAMNLKLPLSPRSLMYAKIAQSLNGKHPRMMVAVLSKVMWLRRRKRMVSGRKLKKPVQGTEATVPDLEAGKDYEFRVLAENAAGESEPSEPSKAVTACDEPDAPTRPEVVDVQKDQAKIKWEAPKNDGGSPIKGYKVQKKEDDGKWQDALKEPVKETEATIPKLDAGKDYEFRVLAENPGGLSEPSQPSKAVTACDEPEAPTQPEVVDVHKDQAKIKWEAPKDDGGSPVKGYVVEKKKKDGEWENALKKPVRDTEATIPNLEAGKDYEFRVLAENPAGLSEPSKPSKAVTACDEPDAPTRPEVVDVHKDRAKLKWEAPKDDGGSPVKGYKVQKKPKDGKWEDAVKEPVLEKEAIVPDLEAGKDYEFRVLAENPGGLSEPSMPSKAVTACDEPEAPAQPEVVDVHKDRAKLKWEAPKDDGGSPIKGYKVQKKPKDGKWEDALKRPVRETEATILDLEAGKDYEFRVLAENTAGLSEPSEPSEAVTAMDEPEAPARPEVVDVHKDEAKIQWAAPKNDGGSPIKGYKVQKKPKGGKWEDALKEPVLEKEAIIPDLEPGKDYEFRVLAENAAGVSEPSRPSNAVTAMEPADAPGDLKVDDITKDSAKLSWTKPKDDGGSPIKGYVVEKREVGKDKWIRCNRVPVKEENFKVEGLEEDKPYEFRVMAENEAGQSEPSKASEPIIAKDPKMAPKIDLSKLPEEVIVKAGQPLKLNAAFAGSPAPEAKWKKDGEEIKPKDMLKIDKAPTETTLTNRAPERADTGDYELTVSNDSGEDTAKVKVIVLDKPSAPEGPLEVSDIYADSCKLHWNPPKDDGGSKLLNYVVEKRDDRRPTWTPVNDNVPPTETSLDVRKLAPGSQCEFRVRAENREGISEPLTTAKPILAKNPYDEPGSPGTPEIVDYDKDFMDLEWKAPENDGGAPIEGYVVEKRDTATSRWTPCFEKPVKDNKCTVEDLIPGREYEYRVSAVNKAGKGKPSKVSNTQKAKPRFAKPTLNTAALRDIRVKAGLDFKFDIPIDGAPPPTVTWKKNGEPIKPSDRVKQEDSETQALLQTKRAERGDTGEYELVLTNDQGTTSAKCNVNVLDKPSSPEGPLKVSDITAESAALSWNPPKTTVAVRSQRT
ncbi:LOW QUALITY PROTEIN: twitchin-like [Ptychodera flava]|uniref:LOW QUALITY PROTEIN: twitchin-like n=1 Tax=Ptychodera flava TaxID=63121 RepID=UPI00396A0D18